MFKKILIENLTCNASVGVYEKEKLNKQKIIISAQRKTATWSGLHRLARKLEFIQSAKDQKN